jgi:hypothetical protein
MSTISLGDQNFLVRPILGIETFWLSNFFYQKIKQTKILSQQVGWSIFLGHGAEKFWALPKNI